MAKGKQSPRQKMINLMYLVFIAMLAMTIDQEVLRSFLNTKESVEASEKATNEKNAAFYANLQEKAKNQPLKFGELYEKSQVVKSKSEEVISYIESIKDSLSSMAGLNAQEGEELNYKTLETQDPVVKYLFKNKSSEPSEKLVEMKNKIDGFRNFILETFDNDSLKTQFAPVIARAKNALNTDVTTKKGGKELDWMESNFYQQPIIAALSTMSVIQQDIRNIESDAVFRMLQEQVDVQLQLNQFTAVVAAPKVILQGDKAEAEIFLGNFDETLPLTVTSNAGTQQVTGKASFNMGTGSIGSKKISGKVSFVNQKGETEEFPFEHEYQVVGLPEGGLVSADKMNVVYRGLPNPISASIPGVDPSSISLSASGNGSLSKAGSGKWNFTPSGGKEVTFTVSGKLANGKTVSSPFKFRIKSVPPPQGQIRKQNSLSVPAGSLTKLQVDADIPDFEFPVSFKVTSFKVKVPGQRTVTVNGNSMRGAAQVLSKAKPGDAVTVFDIKATSNMKVGQRNITPVAIEVQ